MSSCRKSPLLELIEANAPYWGAEAEICRTYFESQERTAETDAAWLLRQCHKEFVEGVLPRLVGMQTSLGLDDLSPGGVPVEDADARVELAHFLAYAEAHRIARGREAQPLGLEDVLGASWPENRALAALRRRDRIQHGDIGARAHRLTEGGYGALYTAGAALKGDDERDRAIARASRLVAADEWGHMAAGIAGLDAVGATAADWSLLAELSVAQGRLRLRMRNAQLGFPVGPERMAELEGGRGIPVEVDLGHFVGS